MGVKFSNNGHSTLAASISSSDTSLTVASGHGARFPSLGAGDYFYATLIDASNNLEIVKCTARSSDVLTITRGQESTTARAYAIGDRIELRVTAQGITDATDIAADSITSTEIAANAVGASELNVSGNGTAGQGLISDGDGTFSWGSGFDEIADVGIWIDTAGSEGPSGPSSNHVSERYGAITVFNSSNLNMRQTSFGNQVITIQESGDYFIKCAGASGGGLGGYGGTAWGVVTLSANDVLYIRVGQQGNVGQSTSSTSSPTSADSTNYEYNQGASTSYGGFGDGKGGQSSMFAGSGGGATAVRLNTDAVANRIIVAGGGGGGYIESVFTSQNNQVNKGGDGGGWVGTRSEGSGNSQGDYANGGTQSAGGSSGPNAGGTGTQAQGGNAYTSNDSGGGGGGYWGGAGGADNCPGGGGSGYVGGMNAANRGMTVGGNHGHGWVYIRKVG